MKNQRVYLTLMLVMICSLSSFAQTEKGNFLIGGSFSINHNSFPGLNSTSVSISPNVSYFFIDRLAAGIILSISSGKSTNDAPPYYESKSSSISAGPVVRYYFPIATKFALFPQVSLTWGKQSNKSTQTGFDYTNDTNTSNVTIGGGATYFLAKNVGIEGLLYYQGVSSSSSSGSYTSNSDQSSVGFRVGLQVYINRNKQ